MPEEQAQNAADKQENQCCAANDNVRQQRVSGILKDVLQQDPAATSKGRRYPWYVDGVLAVGVVVAIAGFAVGMFKMYITHHAQQCIREGNYSGAIALLKGNPLPRFINVAGGRDQDPDELMAHALYLDAMKKMEANDLQGALGELQQIPAGTQQFDTAQQTIVEHFQPSGTQLTGGVVHNEAVAARK